MRTNNNAKWTNSSNSQRIQSLQKTPRAIVGWSEDYPGGHVIGRHHHERSQLLFASRGVMSVTTAEGVWVVPPLRAVWIPAFIDHQIVCSGNVSMRTLYVDQEQLEDPRVKCSVVSVPSLLRELILYAMEMPRLYDINGPDGRIAQVIIDSIQKLQVAPLDLPIPESSSITEIYRALTNNPADQKTLTEWANTVGMTSRTLARRIKAETNLTFGQWRQQIRLLEALRRLGNNDAVTRVAIDLGYDSPSAFISMFKKALGSTPGHYFKNVDSQELAG